MGTGYIVRVWDPNIKEWTSQPPFFNLSSAEEVAEGLHRKGFTVEIDEVRMIRRWHDPSSLSGWKPQ